MGLCFRRQDIRAARRWDSFNPVTAAYVHRQLLKREDASQIVAISRRHLGIFTEGVR